MTYQLVSFCDESGKELIFPQGDVIVWKACGVIVGSSIRNVYVQLLVPKLAKRTTQINKQPNKLGCKYIIEYAMVQQIIDHSGNQYQEAVAHIYQGGIRQKKPMIFEVGKIIRANQYDSPHIDDNTPGIIVHLCKNQCNEWSDD